MPEGDPTPKLLRGPAAARYLGVSYRRFCRLVDADRVPYLPGDTPRSWRHFSVDVLDELARNLGRTSHDEGAGAA